MKSSSPLPWYSRKEVERLKSPDPIERAIAVNRLGELGDKASAAIPFLKELVTDETKLDILEDGVSWVGETSPGQRARSVIENFFLKHAGQKDIPLLMEEVVNGYPGSQGAAARALARLGVQRSIDLIYPLMRHTDAYTRMQAVWALGELRCHSAIDDIFKLVDDEDSWVRRAAVIALGNIRSNRAIKPLLSLLDYEKYSDLRNEISESLKKISGRRLVLSGNNSESWKKWFKRKGIEY